MLLCDALLQPGVAFTKLDEAFFGAFVKLRGDAKLVKFKAVLTEDTEKAFKLWNGLKEFFQLW